MLAASVAKQALLTARQEVWSKTFTKFKLSTFHGSYKGPALISCSESLQKYFSLLVAHSPNDARWLEQGQARACKCCGFFFVHMSMAKLAKSTRKQPNVKIEQEQRFQSQVFSY